MSSFKFNAKVIVSGKPEVVFTVIDDRPEFVATYWEHPTFGRVHANLPHSILELAPRTYPKGTVVKDGEGDLWVALREDAFAYLTVDGVVDVEMARPDDHKLESAQGIIDQYGEIKVLFED